MTINWTGKQEFIHPTQQKNLETKIAKISKLLETSGKGEKQAHLILNHHKNQHRAEITLNYLDHQVVGEHTDPDQYTAINVAMEKFEKQLMKVRDKRRDIKTGPREGWDKKAAADSMSASEAAPPVIPAASNNGSGSSRPQVFRVMPGETKPMSAEEALMEIESDESYMVFLSSDTNRHAVLVRRMDGNFDLVEC
jgi:putative sigma-54 modulation protein